MRDGAKTVKETLDASAGEAKKKFNDFIENTENRTNEAIQNTEAMTRQMQEKAVNAKHDAYEAFDKTKSQVEQTSSDAVDDGKNILDLAVGFVQDRVDDARNAIHEATKDHEGVSEEIPLTKKEVADSVKNAATSVCDAVDGGVHAAEDSVDKIRNN
jgi:ElaB/YqjD/DUF883 family membrane-anchored ribosome-binding protein